MDMCITGTGNLMCLNIYIQIHRVQYQLYMLNHKNSWISQESITTSNSFLLSSYLLSQDNIRLLIKIEEVDLINGNISCCSNGATEDSKDVYNFYGEQYIWLANLK